VLSEAELLQPVGDLHRGRVPLVGLRRPE
jgi:hypothetical protein